MNGISRCEVCGLWLIEEEIVSHAHIRKAIDYRVKGNNFDYFDGFKWNHYKLRTAMQEVAPDESLQGKSRRRFDRTKKEKEKGRTGT